MARQAGEPRILTLDIGGTSADFALIIDGQAQFGTGEMIGEFPLHIPSVSVSSIGGGSVASVDGQGDPFTREAWRVARDVARGYVSVEAAEREYGVVIRDGALDTEATDRLRVDRPAPTGHFHFGPEREGYERQWTQDAYDFLTRTLDGLPIHWRFFAKTEIFSRMAGRSGADGVEAALEEVYARFPEMPRSKAMVREAAE
ncbi:hydantoinase/oxoprolinase family protein [Azospirillum sp. BE72]|uniref:hydantoinase/oxoprolinase family protein n=1 Tax=Azospirillum sp. BE72 TaxID=2817776 RepID=UPI00286719CC|nr:hydantoinase/oxoprolinase family protein [Azospirillum sp. BE72]MDR6773219.1 hypothetical protein [Azospirillum sp. BE72]